MTNSELKNAGDGWQLRWSVSDMRAFKSCPRKFELSNILGYRKRGVEGQQLSFGKILHRALEIWNIERALGRGDGAEIKALTVAAMYGQALDSEWGDDGKSVYTQETLERALVWYFDQYATEEYETLLDADGKPMVEVAFEHVLPGTGYSWSGRVDRVVRSKVTGEILLMDHKTTKNFLGSQYLQNYDLDDQIDGYLYVMSEVLGQPVRGFVVDAVQVGVNFARCMRYDVRRTEAQLNEWLNNEKKWLSFYQFCRKSDYYPYNAGSCKICEFTSVCSAQPGHRQEILDFDFELKEKR